MLKTVLSLHMKWEHRKYILKYVFTSVKKGISPAAELNDLNSFFPTLQLPAKISPAQGAKIPTTA